jgi:hypothetical protein
MLRQSTPPPDLVRGVVRPDRDVVRSGGGVQRSHGRSVWAVCGEGEHRTDRPGRTRALTVGVLSSVVKDRPLIRVKACPRGRSGAAVVAQTPPSMRRGPARAGRSARPRRRCGLVVASPHGSGTSSHPRSQAATDRSPMAPPSTGCMADRAQSAGRGCGPWHRILKPYPTPFGSLTSAPVIPSGAQRLTMVRSQPRGPQQSRFRLIDGLVDALVTQPQLYFTGSRGGC